MTVREYDRPPAILPLYLRAAMPALPVIGSLPGVRHDHGSVPQTTLRRPAITTDLAHLASYADVCGFALRDTLPLTYPHLEAFGLQMALMVDTAFPFRPMGLVHLRNRIVQRRPIGVGESYDVAVRAADLRPHPKGRLIDVTTVATLGGEAVWEETMTLFARGSGAGEEPQPAPLDGVEAPVGSVRWRLDGGLGRRYGAVSGDRNPIHMSRLSAKAFGFPRQIAHGMWSLARAVAAVENRLPSAYVLDAEFRRPILLPTTVSFGSALEGDRLLVGITGRPRGDAPAPTHLVARITPL